MSPDSSAFEVLSFCDSALRVPAVVLEKISGCEGMTAFHAGADAPSDAPLLELVVTDSSRNDWRAFAPTSGAVGGYRRIQTGISVRLDTNAVGLGLALRGLFSLAIERKGGVLVHAACVSCDGRAALITGVSGAGKSTLARWSLHAGATLLSDEVVGVLPDGRVFGTPFRSDPDLLGTPTIGRLAVVTTIAHAAHETFAPLPNHRMVEVLLEQTFHRGGEVTARQALACLARATGGVTTGVLSCRNAPEAGAALRELVATGTRSGAPP